MVRVYIVGRNAYSPFVDSFSKAYLKERGIGFTTNPVRADILLTVSAGLRGYKLAKKAMPFKKFITWTNEPRFDDVHTEFQKQNSITMNVYSGDVFMHNLHFLGSYHNVFSNNLGIDLQAPPGKPLTVQELQAKKKFCVAVFAYRDPKKSKLYINGKNVDLFARRQELAYFMYQRGKSDIVGGNWPDNVHIIESSGFEHGNNNWWDTKIELLKGYKFNICFENTIHPYYCTEKIWHALAGGCLPIYYGEGTAIYDTFPEDSFIDASRFSSHDELLNFMESLPVNEHVTRYNTCLEVMHNACSQRLNTADYKTDIIDKFCNKVYQLVGVESVL